jgi:hypothetical protein
MTPAKQRFLETWRKMGDSWAKCLATKSHEPDYLPLCSQFDRERESFYSAAIEFAPELAAEEEKKR